MVTEGVKCCATGIIIDKNKIKKKEGWGERKKNGGKKEVKERIMGNIQCVRT